MRLIAAIFFLPILCLAQAPSISDFKTKEFQTDLKLFSAAQGLEPARVDRVLKFTRTLASKRDNFSCDTDFLQHLFQQTHRRFLKHYQTKSTFNQLFENGTYNCLTATALYTILLDQFDFDFNVIETNYHIFILANVDSKQILIETTDAANGFIERATEIADRISKYKSGEVNASSSKRVYYQYQQEVFNTISKNQLRGLLHYNLSVDAYNEKNLPASTEQFVSAFALYPSARLEEFSQILQLTIVKSNLDQQAQRKLLTRIQSTKRLSQNQAISMVTE